MKNLNQLDEQGGQIVFAPQNGKPGYRVKKADGSLGQWVPVSPSEYNKPGLKADIERYVKSGGKVYTPPKPEPAKPPKPEPAKPAKPEPSKPAPEASKPAPTRPAPAPVRQPAPQASPVAKYMAAAAAARKSGDPSEMARVRDMGMEIWRKSNPKLAAAADEKARIRGTAQTDNPLMKNMRDRLPLTPSVQSPTLKKDLGNLAPSYTRLTQNPNASIAATPKPAPVTRASVPLANPTVSEPLKPAKPKQTVKSSFEYDAYDLVLEYLLASGHADTLLEAQYVMMQMSADHIQDIVEISGELFRGILNPKNSAASKVQKTSPFNGPVTPLPSIVSPFAKPASRDDSGKLTPYGAGGGSAAEKGGKTRAEVMKQGAKNLENKKPVNQGPDFGR